MVFDYFSFARAKKNQEDLAKTNPQNPVLNSEDEQFLEKVTSQDVPPAPLPPSTMSGPGAADIATKQAAESVSLPTPLESEQAQLAADGIVEAKPRTWGSYIPSKASIPSMPALPAMPAMPNISANLPSMPAMPSMPSMPTWKAKAKDSPAEGTASSEQCPEGIKVTEGVELDKAKAEEDEKEVSVLLDRLNLSSINNRVFSFSDKSQKLYADFTVVLKDMINGAPTAYQDMERLLKDNDSQLREMFNNMPPFIKALVMSLPSKLGTTLGPEIFAAASNKPGADMRARMETASGSKQKKQVPSVEGLAKKQGAVAGMLRSIVAFLQSRFPAIVTGTNVIMSIAVFLLLFVFWYCHKRGRETRLEKENASAEVSDAEGEEELFEGEESGQGLYDEKELEEVLDRHEKERATAETA